MNGARPTHVHVRGEHMFDFEGILKSLGVRCRKRIRSRIGSVLPGSVRTSQRIDPKRSSARRPSPAQFPGPLPFCPGSEKQGTRRNNFQTQCVRLKLGLIQWPLPNLGESTGPGAKSKAKEQGETHRRGGGILWMDESGTDSDANEGLKID